jgi:hypothetical protein
MTNFSADDADNQGDDRTWVDRMFVDAGPDGNVPLEILAHDCAENSNLGGVDVVHNTISLLVDFATATESKNLLRGEHVLVLGGNRPARSGRGRIWVPVSQLPSLISYLQNLQQYLDGNLNSLVGLVRANRDSGG